MPTSEAESTPRQLLHSARLLTVRDNLETLYGAIDDGALDVRLPKHAKKELEAYLDCGLLCRGFARLICEACGESRVVAWSCKVGASAHLVWAGACAPPQRT